MPREGTEGTVRHLFHDAWNRRLLDQPAVAYAADCQVHTSPGRELSRVRALMRVIGLLAAIPDGEMSVDHYCDVDEIAVLRQIYSPAPASPV